jgi:capsular exopolysaccharide synthesis family protein
MGRQLMYSSNNQSGEHRFLEDEIDMKEIFATIGRYKVSITVITLVALFMVVIYAYLSTNIYQADLTMQIQSQSKNGLSGNGQEDFISQALIAQEDNVDNEIAILQSNFIAKKVLEKVQIGTRYYEQKHLRKTELYKSSPFTVDVLSISKPLLGYKFYVHSVDENHFSLTILPSLSMKLRSFFGLVSANEKINYFSQIFAYSTQINNPLFSVILNKNAEMENEDYFFTILPDDLIVSDIQSSLSVTKVTDKSNTLLLSYEDNIPQRAQEVLNAIADAYKEQNIETKRASANQTLRFIDNQLKGINQALQGSANNLEEYKKSNIVIDPKDKGTMATQKYNELENKMSELVMEENVLKNLVSKIKLKKDLVGIDVASLSNQGSPILSIIDKLQNAYALRASLAADYTEKHPSVIKNNQQIDALKTNLLGTIESNLEGIEQKKATLNNIIQKNDAILAALPEEEKQLSHLTNSFSVNQKIYEYLLQKRAETAIIESSKVSGARVIDEAIVSKFPIKPKVMLLILLGLIIGSTLGIVQAFLRNYVSNTIQNINDVVTLTELPLYSVLPFFKEKKSLYVDTLRILLTKLEFDPLGNKPKIITFTSSVPGEGRTTTVSEFATVIGESGKKVIILDLDMRGSKIYKKLNIENKVGISTLLSGTSNLEDVIQNIGKNIDVIVSGPTPQNPYELIISDKLKSVLQELHSKYDYIILESPPAGLVADALVLMRLADLSLIVFKAKYSKKDFVKNINRFVNEHNLCNVGIVLNGLDLSKIRPWLRR